MSQCVRAMLSPGRMGWEVSGGLSAVGYTELWRESYKFMTNFQKKWTHCVWLCIRSEISVPCPASPPGSALLSLRDVAALNTTHHFNYLFGHKKVETGGGGGQPFWPLCLLLDVFGTVFARRCCCCSAYAENR